MQHRVKTTYNKRPVEVTMGWDIPLQGYFMVITPVEDDNPDADPETGLIYSNLDDTVLPFPRLPKQIEHFKKVLLEKQIEVPPEFFGKVLSD